MRRGYVICGYARTGSTLLCRALEATGVLGRPREYFNPNAFWPEPYPTRPDLQIGEIDRRGTTENGVFGVKLFCDQFDSLKGYNSVGALPNPVFVHLERRDALGQAISSVLALQTNRWLGSHQQHGEPVYDEVAIAKQLARFAYDRGRWQIYFARNGIDPLWLIYEDVVEQMEATVRLIGQRVGVSVNPLRLQDLKLLSVQRDDLNEKWRARFLDSQGDLSILDSPQKSSPTDFYPLSNRIKLSIARIGRRVVSKNSNAP